MTGFIIAMHLLASYKNGSLRALPQILPPGLYEVASRRGAPQRQMTGTGARPTLGSTPVTSTQRLFSGQEAQRAPSSMARPAYGTPPLSAQPTGNDWAISPQDKAQFDNIYASVDKVNRGFITGEQAVAFFSNSRLPEDVLAQIWDLADINSEGQLNRDEFAVAMYLIRQQRGKRDGRGVLPSTLPLNLIPPSMRRQPIQPSQPTAPAFDNAANITAPKSASADLFGLDAISPQIPQSTGGSTTYASSNPPRLSDSPQQSQPSSVFKPFMPSSSFGQNMISSQATGGSAGGGHPQGRNLQQEQQQKSAIEDLLGDNDPEISKSLTQETTELANLSNQVGTLSKQMQEVKSKRPSTEQELSRASAQKREFESRLSQLRSLYEREVNEVTALEERLSASQASTKKLQQEMSMLENTLQDLQNQHRQVVGTLQADQQENAILKERIRQTNNESGELRSRLEKIRSDARQQKGLVAINKKQLATNEAERDKLNGDIDGALRELTEATREAEESKKMVQSPSHTQGSATVASPAASTNSQSMNPFFRRAPTATSETAIAPLSFGRDASPPENHSTYDSVFGPSYNSPTQAAGMPPTSYGNESSRQARDIPQVPAPSGQSVRSSEGPDLPTPSTSPPPSAYHESPQSVEPPAPPKSRQITSSFLPLRESMQRSDSVSSSVKVSAPASRFGGDQEGALNTSVSAASVQGQSNPTNTERTEAKKMESTSSQPNSPYFQRTSSASPTASDENRRASKTAERRESYQEFGEPNLPGDIPGAFPEPTPLVPSQPPDETVSSNRTSEEAPNTRSDPFAVSDRKVGGPQTVQNDFDAAFAGFGGPKPMDEAQSSDRVAAPDLGKAQKEFPPIQDLGGDEDSDSASEKGFDDNFTTTSPHRRQHSSSETMSKIPEPGADTNKGSKGLAPPRPSMLTMDSQLPTPGAQVSPPTYEQALHPNIGEPSSPRDANQFPPEFNGLLPSRQDPTSSPPASKSPERSFRAPMSGGQALFNVSSKAREAPIDSSAGFNTASAPTVSSDLTARASSNSYLSTFPDHNETSQQQPPQHTSASNVPSDDFDDEFADLADAREADERVDDEFGSNHRDGFDDFNPIFDSPATTKSGTVGPTDSATQPEESFQGFGHDVGEMNQVPKAGQPPQQSGANSSHDWDAIFAGIDTPQGQGAKPDLPQRDEGGFPSIGAQAGPLGTKLAADKASSMQPPLGRAMTAGSEHDDPILKRLTGMGYPRDQSLSALEKFDYNIDKVGTI